MVSILLGYNFIIVGLIGLLLTNLPHPYHQEAHQEDLFFPAVRATTTQLAQNYYPTPSVLAGKLPKPLFLRQLNRYQQPESSQSNLTKTFLSIVR